MKNFTLTLLFSIFTVLTTFAQIDFDITGNQCVGSELKFTVNQDFNCDTCAWAWDFGDGTNSDDKDSTNCVYSEAGTYTVKLTVSNSIQTYTSTNHKITVGDNPDCSFEIDTTNYSSYSRIFTNTSTAASNISAYVWDFGDGESVSTTDSAYLYKYSEAGEYTVWAKVVDVKGCADSISQTVTIENIYRVPNVFSPNGDGINDNFIVTVNGVDYFSIEIFSRWGNMVFKRNGVQQIIWDGCMPDGNRVKPGTYFYVITASNAQQIYEPETGFVTVFYGAGGSN